MTRRYLQLIEELAAAEDAPARGWQTRVAARLGVAQSSISRMVAGQVAIGLDSLDKAQKCLGLRRAYFTDPDDPRSYLDYLADSPPYAAWPEFLRRPYAKKLRDHERASLTALVFPPGKVPSVAFYEGVLRLLRDEITPGEFHQGLALAEEIDARIAAKRLTRP